MIIVQSEPVDDTWTFLLKVVDNQERNQALQWQYIYQETITNEHLRKDGTVAKLESETFEVIPTPGGVHRRMVARSPKPLSAGDEREEEKKFQRQLEKDLKLSSDEREEALEQFKNRVGRFRTRLRRDIAAFNFTPLPDEDLNGRPVRVLQFSPRPDYVPRSRSNKVLTLLEGTMWIDPEHYQILKLHLRFNKDMNFFLGLFGRVSKGTEAVATQKRVDDDVWLLDNIDVMLRGRFYFFKVYRRQITYSYSDYEKFEMNYEDEK